MRAARTGVEELRERDGRLLEAVVQKAPRAAQFGARVGRLRAVVGEARELALEDFRQLVADDEAHAGEHAAQARVEAGAVGHGLGDVREQRDRAGLRLLEQRADDDGARARERLLDCAEPVEQAEQPVNGPAAEFARRVWLHAPDYLYEGGRERRPLRVADWRGSRGSLRGRRGGWLVVRRRRRPVHLAEINLHLRLVVKV